MFAHKQLNYTKSHVLSQSILIQIVNLYKKDKYTFKHKNPKCTNTKNYLKYC